MNLDVDTTGSAADAGIFMGWEVHTGPGGGLATPRFTPRGVGRVDTHYHAARLPHLGDVVLAVTRRLDDAGRAPRELVLRAFTATTPQRERIAAAPAHELLSTPGGVAVASLELGDAGDGPDDRRPAQLVRCVVSDVAPTAAAARDVATWLADAWESELAFGSWPAVVGSLAAFAPPAGGAPAEWARAWLRDREYQVEGADDPARGHDSDRFIKVLDATWLEHGPGDRSDPATPA